MSSRVDRKETPESTTARPLDAEWIAKLASAAMGDGTPPPNGRTGVADEIDAVVARARSAFRWWSERPVAERVQWMLRFRARLVESLDEVVATVGRELNKPRLDVLHEVFHCCQLIGFYAQNAEKMLRSRRTGSGVLVNKRAEIRYRPLGVVGVVAPWNYPIVLVVSPVVQALLAGNSVVVKPSEQAVKTALLLGRLFDELRWPEPVVQIVPGGHETAIALVEAGVDKVSFTGGRRGAQAILRAAAGRLTPVVTELGGNDPMLVSADADLGRAANAAVWGAFLNAGQSCIGIERCFVDRRVADSFIQQVVDATKKLSVGLAAATEPPPRGDRDHDVGPMRSAEQFERVRELVDDAVRLGAKVLTGGVPTDASKLLFPPTVLVDVDLRMRVMREETFGPILPILRVPDMETAVEYANDSVYGLGASVWTRDLRNGRRLAQRLNVGGVVVNDCLVHFAIPQLPFGGVKQSGFGRSQGQAGLHEFCATQTVVRHLFGPRMEFQWFPYGAKHRMIEPLLRVMYGGKSLGKTLFDAWMTTGGNGKAPPKNDGTT
ncbi:MAG: aldehyde dehydrogenase family protein [Planctomycetia bacterium]